MSSNIVENKFKFDMGFCKVKILFDIDMVEFKYLDGSIEGFGMSILDDIVEASCVVSKKYKLPYSSINDARDIETVEFVNDNMFIELEEELVVYKVNKKKYRSIDSTNLYNYLLIYAVYIKNNFNSERYE